MTDSGCQSVQLPLPCREQIALAEQVAIHRRRLATLPTKKPTTRLSLASEQQAATWTGSRRT